MASSSVLSPSLSAFSQHCTAYYTQNPPPPSSLAVLDAFTSLQSSQPLTYDALHKADVESCGLLADVIDLAQYADAQARARRDAHSAMASARREAFRALLAARGPASPLGNDVASGLRVGTARLRGRNQAFEASVRALVEAQIER